VSRGRRPSAWRSRDTVTYVARPVGTRAAPLLLLLLLSPGCNKWHSDRSAAAYLQTILSAQADFQANDRDGNQVNDYWVKDVAGLYGLDTGTGPIKLIHISDAQADRTPSRARYASVSEEKPVIGYWFAALKRHQQSGKSVAYDDGTGRNPSRFGLVAFPAEYLETSRLTFIVNEKGIIFSKDTKDKPPEEFPEDPVKDGWADFSKTGK
jgi:DUF2950 family protein